MEEVNLKKLPGLFLILSLTLLIACDATTAEATAVAATHTPQATTTALAEATATLPPPPATEPVATAVPPATVTAVATMPALPQPPDLPAAAEVLFTSAGHMAFIQNRELYIQDLARENPPVLIDNCADIDFCGNHFLKWSPDGQYLLYYHTENFESNEIRLATVQGEWQTIGTEAHFIHPAAWSPDGRNIAYLRDTGELQEIEIINDASGETITMPAPLMEVMTISVADGLPHDPQVKGTLTLQPDGCGGGGRSASEVLYENEGGTAYGYLMGVLEWTAQDILLFTRNCTNVGMGRYDLANTTQLEAFDSPLRNLVLSPDKSRWYAVSGNIWSSEPGNNELVTGTPDDTVVTVIPTSNPIEMVFSGNQSGSLYLTSRVLLNAAEPSGMDFRFYETTLWQLDADGGGETAVYQAQDQAIARVQEAADGILLFVRIENDAPLYAALEAGVPAARLPDYAPKRHIVALNAAGELLYLLPDAGSLAATP